MGGKKKRSIYQGYNIIPNTNIVDDNSPRWFFRVSVFDCKCQNKKYAFWESPAEGAENGEYCFNPKCKGNPRVMGTQMIGTTPVQEKDRKLFGHFKCHRCERHWCSAHSWPNTGQRCHKCDSTVFPFIQEPIRRRQKPRKKVPHDKSACQKCKEIGGDCSQKKGRQGRRKLRGRKRNGGKKTNKKAEQAEMDGVPNQAEQMVRKLIASLGNLTMI